MSMKMRFCSDYCCQKWWNSHPEAVDRKAWYTLTCAYCGKEFKSYGNKKYCSKECYYNARFGTKEERAQAAAEKEALRRAELEQREFYRRAELSDHCLHCPYYLKAKADQEE